MPAASSSGPDAADKPPSPPNTCLPAEPLFLPPDIYQELTASLQAASPSNSPAHDGPSEMAPEIPHSIESVEVSVSENIPKYASALVPADVREGGHVDASPVAYTASSTLTPATLTVREATEDQIVDRYAGSEPITATEADSSVEAVSNGEIETSGEIGPLAEAGTAVQRRPAVEAESALQAEPPEDADVVPPTIPRVSTSTYQTRSLATKSTSKRGQKRFKPSEHWGQSVSPPPPTQGESQGHEAVCTRKRRRLGSDKLSPQSRAQISRMMIDEENPRELNAHETPTLVEEIALNHVPQGEGQDSRMMIEGENQCELNAHEAALDHVPQVPQMKTRSPENHESDEGSSTESEL